MLGLLVLFIFLSFYGKYQEKYNNYVSAVCIVTFACWCSVVCGFVKKLLGRNSQTPLHRRCRPKVTLLNGLKHSTVKWELSGQGLRINSMNKVYSLSMLSDGLNVTFTLHKVFGVWRHVQHIGLAADYKINRKLRKLVRKVMAIGFYRHSWSDQTSIWRATTEEHNDWWTDFQRLMIGWTMYSWHTSNRMLCSRLLVGMFLIEKWELVQTITLKVTEPPLFITAYLAENLWALTLQVKMYSK